MAKATVTADNTFTDAITVNKDYFEIIVSGTFSATITVQEQPSEGAAWIDIKQYTEADLPIRKVSNTIRRKSNFRIGVKTGDFTSGTINLEIR